MTEAQFPSGPRNVAQAIQNASNTETNARAVTLPEAIQAEAHARGEELRLRGEVIRSNQDGSVTVRTDRGDIDLQADNQRSTPPRGQEVEILVPTQRESTAKQDIPVEIRHASPEQTQQRASSTPVNVEVRSDTPPPPPQTAPPTEQPAQPHNLPAEGSVVRLQPTTPQTVQNLPPALPAETSVSTLPQRVEFQAQIIASEAVSQLQTALTNTLQTAPPITLDSTAPITNLVTNLQSPAIVRLSEVSTPIPQGLPQSIANIVSSISRALPNATGQNADVQGTSPRAFIESAVVPSVTPNIAETVLTTPITATAPQPLPLNTRPAPLDVQINQIVPPAVTVNTPATSIEVQASRTINPYIPVAIDSVPAPERLITQNQSAPALTGVVTNITQAQLPVVSVVFPQISSEQLFTLQFPTENVTIGTQIQVTPLANSDGSALLSAAAAGQNVPLTAVLQPATQWPAIEEILQSLARNAPQAAQSILNVTPSPSSPAQMSPAILFFVAAVRGGDIAQWLGEKAQNILKLQKSTKALSKLGSESQMLGRVSSETFSQDWRAMNIPMLWQGDLHKVALYYKHDREQSDDEQSKINSTRFVFDLTLENMGNVQLDGLFRPQSEAGTRLDLVVRTEEIFSKATQGEMRRLYASALRDSQVTGELSFQNQPDSWVTIHAKHHDGLSVQS